MNNVLCPSHTGESAAFDLLQIKVSIACLDWIDTLSLQGDFLRAVHVLIASHSQTNLVIATRTALLFGDCGGWSAK